MSDTRQLTARQYVVVAHPQGRLALWPNGPDVPRPWREVFGASGKSECLRYICDDHSQRQSLAKSAIQISLMFFGDTEDNGQHGKYDLLLKCARFADRHGLSAVWLPERHFTRFGCLFPNPSVLCAALARETERIRLRAGSVVLPLQDPIRVAEEWSVVDNLSGGRIDLALASGWHPDDFALAPDKYEQRREIMFRDIETLKCLWRGDRIEVANGTNKKIEVRVFPTPLQRELNLWITAASNPESFIKAGQIGANVLTHLFDQQIDTLSDKISTYRQARRESGLDPETGQVTVVLHAFLADTLKEVRRQAQKPYCNYLKANFPLLKNLAISRGVDVNVAKLAGPQLDELLEYLFEKFVGDRSLLGTPETCSELIGQLSDIGVTEVACLVDFGPKPDAILANLPNLAKLVG